jgi:hypothetical protein
VLSKKTMRHADEFLSILRVDFRSQQRWDDFRFLLFAQSWPDNDRSTLSGWLSVWNRWLWLPLVLCVAFGVRWGSFHGKEWLLPVLLAAALVMLYRSRHAARPSDRSNLEDEVD